MKRIDLDRMSRQAELALEFMRRGRRNKLTSVVAKLSEIRVDRGSSPTEAAFAMERLQELRSLKIDLFLHQQCLDTTTPAGKMMFQVLGSFAEYERDMIRARVNAGIARAKAAGKHSGRPPLAPELAERIRQAMAVPGRPGIRVIAKQFGVSPMTVQNVAN